MSKQEWEIQKLGNVCKIEYGTRIVKKNSEGTLYPVYGGGNITFYTDSFNREDSMIIARFGLSPQCTRYISGKFFLNDSGLTLVSINPSLYQKFLDKFISCNNNKIYNLSRGAAQRNLHVKSFLYLDIPIPPLPIQNQIVKELDTLQSIITKKKAQLEELDKLAQTTFYDMFGDLERNKFNFPKEKLENIFIKITDGTHQTPTYTDDKINGIKFLSSKDVTTGKINWRNIKYIPQWLHEELSERLKPQKGDILLAKNGTTGVCALVETDDIFDIYVSLALLRPKESFNKVFLLHAINNPDTKSQFNGHLKGVGVPNLHLKEIRKTEILVPPLPLQNQFAERIKAIEKQKALINQSIAETQLLFDSAMDNYFN